MAAYIVKSTTTNEGLLLKPFWASAIKLQAEWASYTPRMWSIGQHYSFICLYVCAFFGLWFPATGSQAMFYWRTRKEQLWRYAILVYRSWKLPASQGPTVTSQDRFYGWYVQLCRLCGKVPLQAPEILAQNIGKTKSPYTFASDVYAFGVCVYELITFPHSAYPLPTPWSVSLLIASTWRFPLLLRWRFL